MQAVQYVLLWLVGVAATYLYVWRPTESPQVSSGLATLAWMFLIPASGTVTRYSGGEAFTTGSQVLQAWCFILTILSALTLIGAVTGKYPTDSMLEETNDSAT